MVHDDLSVKNKYQGLVSYSGNGQRLVPVTYNTTYKEADRGIL